MTGGGGGGWEDSTGAGWEGTLCWSWLGTGRGQGYPLLVLTRIPPSPFIKVLHTRAVMHTFDMYKEKEAREQLRRTKEMITQNKMFDWLVLLIFFCEITVVYLLTSKLLQMPNLKVKQFLTAFHLCV